MAKAEKKTFTVTTVTETEGVQLTLTNDEAITLARLLGWHVAGLGEHRARLDRINEALMNTTPDDYFDLGRMETSSFGESIYLL